MNLHLHIPHTIITYKFGKKRKNGLKIFVQGNGLDKGTLCPTWNIYYGDFMNPVGCETGNCLEDIIKKLNKKIETDYFHDCDLLYYYPKGNT